MRNRYRTFPNIRLENNAHCTVVIIIINKKKIICMYINPLERPSDSNITYYS